MSAPEWKDMADWSALPDVYVTKVQCQQNMFWRVEACSVPMVIGPELRLVRADLAAAKDARIAELERQLAEAREVNPLEWVAIEQDRGDGSSDLTGDWTAETPFSAYSIVVGWGTDSYIFDVYYGEAGFVSSHDDPDRAKDAAQADYAARVLSALKEPKP